LVQTVNRAASVTALGATPNPSVFAQAVTLNATVTPVSATGTVTFKDGANTLGSVTLTGGAASFTSGVAASGALSVGAHSFTASYDGDTNIAPSSSVPQSQTVGRAQ